MRRRVEPRTASQNAACFAVSAYSGFVRTIARIIRDNTGRISFGDVDLQHRQTHELRSLGISWFVQGGMVLPSLTVQEHFEIVLKGHDRPTQARLKDERLNQFPTLLELMPKRGGNLSGGQRQRVGLARARFAGRPIQLLDDSLSAMDVETERRVVSELLQGRWQKSTRVLATHRLSVLSHCDRVVFLENGRVSDQGPFQDLIHRNAQFRAFVQNTDEENKE